MRLKPKNWDSFQHYKDRCPPWVKLHKSILDDRAFMSLPLASKALAPLMWLLASESKDGTFDGSVEELAFRLRITEKEIREGIKPLIDKGFFLDASDMLAPASEVHTFAVPETETETETDPPCGDSVKPKKQKTSVTQADMKFDFPDLTEQVIADYLELRKTKRAPLTKTAWAAIAKEIKKTGLSADHVLTIAVTKGWQGFEAEWIKPSAFVQHGGGQQAPQTPTPPRRKPMPMPGPRTPKPEGMDFNV